MLGVLLLVASTLACSFAQILELKPGSVHGFEYTTKGGEVAEVFLGIPYAAAPIGELRFEISIDTKHFQKPVPVVPWKGVRNGTQFGATCHPHARKAALTPNPNEDCLTVNVIRPKKEAPAGGYPILLWVHGGGYEIGSASLYGYKGFADIYIPHDIIVVTLQYRLGVYGFFSSGDSRMPGNLGLFDMAEAVKVILDFILSIEGFLIVIFHGYANFGLDCIKWGPVIDGEFLQDPDEMATTAPPKASIIGISNKEAAFFTIKARANTILSNLGISHDDFLLWNRDKLIATIKDFIRHEFFESNTDEVIDKVIAYYVDRDEEDSYDFYLDRYTEFISDVMFNVPAVDGILSRRDKGWELFAYSFNHYNKAIWPDDLPKRLKGSTHVNEYPYMFDIFAMGEFEIDETEQIVADVVQQSFINFVKTGVPLNQYGPWQDVGASTDLSYLAISPKPQMEQGFYNEPTAFWHELRKYGYDLIKQASTGRVDRIMKNEL
ncbi:unnamed protein product [Haemonchus placei]|uniref:COesterase domain-containing protein n=1 Tax=Haemonchus placei TaxID=6290 RepID=A0A0N4X493_HAEPC|nr:unnamed protein product [Haemonchus placei]